MRFFLLLALLCPLISSAQTDPFNTLRWSEGDTGDWYEWWYYKVVEPKTGEAFFFTYGVVNPGDGEGEKAGTKSLVQAGSFGQKVSVERDFPLTAFHAERETTAVSVGNNSATDRHLEGAITDDQGQPISWKLELEKDWTFDAMGWATGVGGISNIYWYPAQASARMSGTIRFRGQEYKFDHAPAYQDRNWGRSFPEWWTWLVSNHFQNSPGTVLAAGGGKPQAFGFAPLFSGLCIGLRHEGEEYIFRTTDGDEVDFDIRWGKWEVSAVNDHGQKIEISAQAPQEKFLLLPFTTPRGDRFYDYETLNGNMQVKLYTRESDFDDWQLKANLTSDQAGIEWGSPDPVSLATLFLTGQKLQ